MEIFVYDGTFEGLLCAVFESYTRKCIPDSVVSSANYSAGLWDTVLTIDTDRERADRVWKSLQGKLSAHNKQLPFHAFLYGMDAIDQAVFNFIRLAFDMPHPVDYDYANADVLKVKQAQKVVAKEAMRTIQFVRFQKTADDIYFSALSPAFDVIPLVTQHFLNRFKDQQWVIYDLKREYGVFYDLKEVKEITLDNPQFSRLTGEIDTNIMKEDEAGYQNLWQNYVQAVTIRERLNLKLQLQHMPRRYWKYLTEMQRKKS
jgi:probable DNA metabolism protein